MILKSFSSRLTSVWIPVLVKADDVTSETRNRAPRAGLGVNGLKEGKKILIDYFWSSVTCRLDYQPLFGRVEDQTRENGGN